MKILALDSSSLVASVAIMEEKQLIAEYTVNYKKTHSQTLLPMLDEIVKMTETDMESIDYIAISEGPGSFTGLRIGSATAKGLGLALEKPLVCIPTLEALAANFYQSPDLICPIMDARRNQVYTAIYEQEDMELTVLKEQMPMDIKELIDEINSMNRAVVFLGDGVPVYEEIIREHIKVPFTFAPAHLSRQRASAVAARALSYIEKGQITKAAEHKPEYLRVSQAERERMERGEKIEP